MHFQTAVRGWCTTASKAARDAIEPASTARESLLVDIGVLTEQARGWRRAMDDAHRVQRAAELAEQVFEAYSARQGRYFSDILDRISARVADIYSRLHPNERLAEVRIEPWGEKGVELAVSFHGSVQKPPHGVLSESHLNSLAIALFLAMADTFNERLDFVVLDDVVNSFDSRHRAELATLLAEGFAHRQLIVLTHDRLFYERLRRLAPNWEAVELTSWAFDEGPRTAGYAAGTVLNEAVHALAAGDTRGAAMKGRRALEEFLQELCEHLHAPLPFRRGLENDRREPGELLEGARRRIRELSSGTYAAQRPLLDELQADLAAALHVESHASQAEASSEEIRGALDRIERLIAEWTCSTCGTRVWRRGSQELFSCRCGQRTFPSGSGADGNPSRA
jgi:hypothetical protein